MSDNNRNDNPNDPRAAAPAPASNWERETLERLVFATVREQRAARRWGIFFKLSFLLLAFFAIWAYFDFNFGSSDIEALGRHKALIEIDGAIEDEGIEAVICGRAIYTGDLDFAKAQARADELSS